MAGLLRGLWLRETRTLQQETALPRTWWMRGRPFTLAELVADGVVHTIGLVMAIGAGSVLLAVAGYETAPKEFPALVVYVVSLLVVLGISMAFNLTPMLSPARRVLARLDQAAIFFFIAGTYTPFLTMLGHTTAGLLLTAIVWGGAALGMILKLTIPHRFGRSALVVYLGVGWSGVLVFQSLAASLPPHVLWLMVAGGMLYSAGIVFHLWERLSFHNALWHGFVVAGASLHLWAVLDVMVLSRL
jgi:hemolysin III